MKLPRKKRHLTDIAYISCATGIELVLVHSELTFLATNFNLVAKKKKVFGLSRENRIAVRRTTFNPALARLLLYLLSSPSSTSLFQPFCRPLFWLLASKLFPPTFSQIFNVLAKPRVKGIPEKTKKRVWNYRCRKRICQNFATSLCFALQNPLFLKLRMRGWSSEVSIFCIILCKSLDFTIMKAVL